MVRQEVRNKIAHIIKKWRQEGYVPLSAKVNIDKFDGYISAAIQRLKENRALNGN
jgi:hypothetical protein